MTVTLYRRRYEGRRMVGFNIPDMGMSIEVLGGRKAKRHIRFMAKMYGVTKIKRGLNK
jgi:hypothetical protein